MKTLILVVLLTHGATAVTHSLKYFYTGSSGIPNFPEYVSVGYVDGIQMIHCDSIINRNVPSQDWMNRITADYPQYFDSQTQICLGLQQSFKANTGILKARFNQTGGVHIFQNMYGCEWDSESGDTNGYDQYGYDGEDFLSLDVKKEIWIAPNPQAVITKHKWDNDKADLSYLKNYYTQECIDWLKKYVNYGRSTLLRTDLPSVSLLQKSPPSLVTCHATGFYPDRATMFWRKDGQELHEDVEHGEILPNHDGTFQMTVDLKLSSVKPEDWKRYDCVFQLSGVKDVVTKLDKGVIRINGGSSEFPTGVIIGVVVGLLLLAVCIAGFLMYRKKNKEGQGFKPATKNSETSSENSEELAKMVKHPK